MSTTGGVRSEARLDLYWIPLGAGDRAGQRIVRLSGRVFEAVAAAIAGRARSPLFHAALVATLPEAVVSVEMAPAPDDHGRTRRGVVAEGPVGSRVLARFRVFRYEVRRWRGGVIPDLPYAVASPVQLTDDPRLVERVLDTLPQVPTPVWGRDELDTGEMWNSNSVVSWVLARARLADTAGHPPDGGRAPGWSAGIEVAARGAIGELSLVTGSRS